MNNINPSAVAAIGYSTSLCLWVATLVVLDGIRRCAKTGDVVGAVETVQHAFMMAVAAIVVAAATRLITGGAA